MKSLKELAIKHGIKESHYIRGDEYIFTIEQLESLINEVISQRLGEPVAIVDKYAGGTGIIAQQAFHSLPKDTKLYALNIESQT